MTNILIVGSGAREHAIAKALQRANRPTKLLRYFIRGLYAHKDRR